jgi:GTP diphosphokinase / guanosine-3',5'-bis(diphosphate) 3'-diphosphatase
MSEFTQEEKERIEAEFAKVLSYCPKVFTDAESMAMVRKAFDLANKAHYGSRRKSGEPYIFHPLAVAKIVSGEMGLGVRSIIGSLLHDVVEDTDYTVDDIRDMFDERIASIIDGLTKIKTALKTKSSQAENIRKMLLTLSEDARVILIKIADRLHNMRTMDSMAPDRQIDIAAETRMLFVPLAHRMGFNAIKTELDDLCLKYEQPQVFNEITAKLKDSERRRQHYLNRFCIPLMIKLESNGIEFDITSRSKSIASIWNKIQFKKVPFEDIYDLFAVRIIIKNISHEDEKNMCWRVYSLITDEYQPNPDRLRDWIGSPRENGYESLHTTVMGPEGRWVEVQIRTTRMDEIAERGLAAHWKYKGQSFEEGQLDIWLKKLKQTLHNPDSDAQAFLDEFKLNLYTSEIFVFTPSGELRRMPIGSCVLDLAFDIHTKLGIQAVGGKVNRHKTVPLDYKLQSGDQVEIITSEKQIPQQSWLNFVITAKAKNSLRFLFKNEKKKSIKRGQAIVEIMIKELGYDPEEHIYRKLLDAYSCHTKNDLFLYASEKGFDSEEFKGFVQKKRENKIIKYWKVQFDKVVNLISDSTVEEIVDEQPKEDDTIALNDSANYIVASCCNPIPGDSILGVQRGLTLTVHQSECPIVKEYSESLDVDIIKIKWVKQEKQAFLVRIKLSGFDRLGLLNDVMQVLSKDFELNIRTLHFDTTEKYFEGLVDLYVLDVPHLNNLMSKLQDISGVKAVQRVEKIE